MNQLPAFLCSKSGIIGELCIIVSCVYTCIYMLFIHLNSLHICEQAISAYQ